MIDDIQKRLLKEIADLDSLPVGAYNIRANGRCGGPPYHRQYRYRHQNRPPRHRYHHRPRYQK